MAFFCYNSSTHLGHISTLYLMLVNILLVLQLKTYKVKSKEKSCIKVNIRKLNEVPNTKYLPYIY